MKAPNSESLENVAFHAFLQSLLHFANFIFSAFRDNDHYWYWMNEEGDEFFFDKDEVVRFRVEAEVWHDLTPQKPSIVGEESTVPINSKKSDNKADASTSNVPYTIIVSDSYHKDYQRFTKCLRGINAATRTWSYSVVARIGTRRSYF